MKLQNINPFLSAPVYGVTHIDSSQSDAIPYEVPKGTFHADVRKSPRVATGPVSIITLAAAIPGYMWGASSQAVTYIDISNDGFKEVARYTDAFAKDLPAGKLDEVLAEEFKTMADVENAANNELGMNERNMFANIYTLVDADNTLFSASLQAIRKYNLVSPEEPELGIKLIGEVDLKTSLNEKEQYFPVNLNLTYDGYLIVLSSQSIRILNRETLEVLDTVQFGADELVTNSMAVDDANGIYVASDKIMRKLVWTGSKLSTDEADGAWQSAYSYGDLAPSVKFGKGTGSTPTLMGFDDDQDQLVVITDGVNHMNIVAFWRNEIPEYAKPVPGAQSNRIAGLLGVTCGLNPKPNFIQSEQSVVVQGYGAFVVNNVRDEGNDDRLLDVLAGGPVLKPSLGCERFEWNPETHEWKSVWTRNDVSSISMVPVVSTVSNIAFVNGYEAEDGWVVTGMDWETGETVFKTIFGHDNFGNGAYAIIQFFENGDMLFNSIAGPARIKF